MQYKKTEIIESLKNTINQKTPIIASGAGTGISAKFTEKGGADLIVIYNSGRYRMAGHTSWAGLLPIGDANKVVLQMGEREVLPVVKKTPVIAGVFASDPTRNLDTFLNEVKRLGFSGVINFPTVGIIEGQFRDSLESNKQGFQCEVDLVSKAKQMDLLTLSYVFTPKQAEQMATAGADIIVAHMGNTSGGSVGQNNASPLEKNVQLIIEISDAARKINAEVIVLCHGGNIANPEDASYIFDKTGIEGFVGASSLERIPIEKPLTERTEAFKMLSIHENKNS